MASNRIFAAIILSTILLPTVMAVKCHSTAIPGRETDECQRCIVLVAKNGDVTQGCATPPRGKSLDIFVKGKCTAQDNGSKYFTCDTDLCNTCCDNECGPVPKKPTPAPPPAAAAKKPSGSASCQPMVVVLVLGGVVHLLH